MADGTGDDVWDAFVTAMMAAGPVRERRSRYAGKPALWTDRREIAHLEALGVIDLRLTRPAGPAPAPSSATTPASGGTGPAATGSSCG